ncbi:MAG: adenosylcobinamide-phosphate synthase CbiB [Pseudomonadota bacterium]
MSAAALMLLAWALEIALGWPNGLYRRVRHPVVWIGTLAGTLDAVLNLDMWNHKVRYALGALTALLTIGTTAVIAFGLSTWLPNNWWGILFEALIASSLIASRSLYAHVAAVARPLASGDLQAARAAVSKIVGRDPNRLDEAGIARAGLESLAENASDGVIAPLFWGAVFGLPGLAAYKAINTLDSMIGHKNTRHAAFGGFSARLDDVANFIPARLTGILISAASFKVGAFNAMAKDACHHRSPNAGWPEAAMAGGLGVQLSGPRSYESHVSDEPWLNEGARNPSALDLRDGMALYQRAMVLAAALLVMPVLINL